MTVTVYPYLLDNQHRAPGNRNSRSSSAVSSCGSELLENPQCAVKAAEIGRIIQAENGVGVACDRIEKQLSF